MSDTVTGHASRVERSCAFVVAALSEGRRQTARLISGERRSFGLSPTRTTVHIPYPILSADWTLRSLTCGAALQCAPSKDRIAQYPLHALTARQLSALTLVEGAVAIAWISARWPGLLPEIRRLAPDPVLSELDTNGGTLDAPAMLDRAQALAASKRELPSFALLGRLPQPGSGPPVVMAALRKLYGQMPWSSKRPLSQTIHTIPVTGQGGVQNPNLPPPSRPEEDDLEIRKDRRAGIPYPEWNMWKQAFLLNHVAVLERKHVAKGHPVSPASPELRRWFEEHTHRAIKNRLEDGSDLDVDQYVAYRVDAACGMATEARVFRDLLPTSRDVATAVLLDGSSSLGANGGRIFKLELACADALSGAMTLARERHGLFVFSGDTRHRVEVACLKDFEDRHFVAPGSLGLVTGGYTRLGAPLRHLTSRLMDQHCERRLLIVIGDGLMSDEGYEGKYAWADVAHAIEEADEAGVSIYYIGIGPTRVDPLPEVFGSRRSTRIRRVEELPRVLAHVHRELISA